jgi:hypothetical protein
MRLSKVKVQLQSTRLKGIARRVAESPIARMRHAKKKPADRWLFIVVFGFPD